MFQHILNAGEIVPTLTLVLESEPCIFKVCVCILTPFVSNCASVSTLDTYI